MQRVFLHRGTKPKWKIPAPYRHAPLCWFVANDGCVYWALYRDEEHGWLVLDNDGHRIADNIETIAQVRAWATQGEWT